MPITEGAIYVNLNGPGGNAFAIVAAAKRSMQDVGTDKETITAYTEEALKGSYEDLLALTEKYVYFQHDFVEPDSDYWDEEE